MANFIIYTVTCESDRVLHLRFQGVDGSVILLIRQLLSLKGRK